MVLFCLNHPVLDCVPLYIRPTTAAEDVKPGLTLNALRIVIKEAPVKIVLGAGKVVRHLRNLAVSEFLDRTRPAKLARDV